MLLRSLVSTLLFGAVSVIFIGCTSGGAEGTPEPIVPTATLTLTASPGPTETPAPTETPPAGEPRRTGDPALDAIIEAVEERDIAAIASLVEYQVLGCTTAQGMGGPPKCGEGQADGDEVAVFPVAVCEVEWRDRAVLALSEVVLGARGLYAAVDPTDGATLGGEWPESDALLVLHQEFGDELTGSRLHVADGRIVAMMRNCDLGQGPDALTGSGGADSEPYPAIAGPWEEPQDTHAVEVPSTGIDAVDSVLSMVAHYDAAGLAESARDAMDDLPDMACEEPPLQGPGGIACDPKNGETAGDMVSVFPLAFCEGTLERDPMRSIQVVLDGAPQLHAIVGPPREPSASDLYPHGAYWIIYELTPGETGFESAARLHITAEGNLTAIWYGCGPPIEQLLQLEGEPLPEIEVSEG